MNDLGLFAVVNMDGRCNNCCCCSSWKLWMWERGPSTKERSGVLRLKRWWGSLCCELVVVLNTSSLLRLLRPNAVERFGVASSPEVLLPNAASGGKLLFFNTLFIKDPARLKSRFAGKLLFRNVVLIFSPVGGKGMRSSDCKYKWTVLFLVRRGRKMVVEFSKEEPESIKSSSCCGGS